MKIVRVPWIRCRADEVDAVSSEVAWRGHTFEVIAYSQKEALDWWRSLGEREREGVLGMGNETTDEGPGLF